MSCHFHNASTAAVGIGISTHYLMSHRCCCANLFKHAIVHNLRSHNVRRNSFNCARSVPFALPGGTTAS